MKQQKKKKLFKISNIVNDGLILTWSLTPNNNKKNKRRTRNDTAVLIII